MPAAAIAAGGAHACAIDAAGAVRCWGADDLGQLGDGTPAANRSAPTEGVGHADPGRDGTARLAGNEWLSARRAAGSRRG